MQSPMLWNTLDDSAAWLTAATGREHTAKQILSLGLSTYRDQFKKFPPTFFKAAPPINTCFGMYQLDAGKENGMVRQHEMPWQPIPLYPKHLRELMSCGETYVSIAKSPTEWDGRENEYVLIEPIDELFKVNMSMIGLVDRDLLEFVSLLNHVASGSSAETQEANVNFAAKPVLTVAKWEEAVREVADEFHARDLAAGAYSSNKNMADRLALAAIERAITGPHGQLTAANILREALQGDRWQRKPALKTKA